MMQKHFIDANRCLDVQVELLGMTRHIYPWVDAISVALLHSDFFLAVSLSACRNVLWTTRGDGG